MRKVGNKADLHVTINPILYDLISATAGEMNESISQVVEGLLFIAVEIANLNKNKEVKKNEC